MHRTHSIYAGSLPPSRAPRPYEPPQDPATTTWNGKICVASYAGVVVACKAARGPSWEWTCSSDEACAVDTATAGTGCSDADFTGAITKCVTEKSASASAWPATRACEKAKLIRGCYPDSCKVAKAGPADIAFRNAEAAVTKACPLKPRCRVDEHVGPGPGGVKVCIACAAGYTNAANDDPNGADTTCDEITCVTNFFVLRNVCTACPSGRVRVAGDKASGADTVCSKPAGRLLGSTLG